MMQIPFFKAHGLGNDYIFFDLTDARLSVPPGGWCQLDWSTVSRRLSDRHTGIGGDGIVLILPFAARQADLQMRIFNADGSEAEMCGNAARCVGLYAVTNHLVRGHSFKLMTMAGVKHIFVDSPKKISVDMGKAKRSRNFKLDDSTYYGVNMGNPHAVRFLPFEPTDEIVHTIGPTIENHSFYANRTNVEFAYVTDSHHITMRVWERGSGETMACGTGACATAFAAIKQAYCQSPIIVTLRGGELTITINDKQQVIMSGPAEIVYSGYVNYQF